MPARAPDKVSALGTAGRQAGVAMLKYCIVLSLGKNRSKQSTCNYIEQSNHTGYKQPRITQIMYRLVTGRPSQMARMQTNKVYIPSCFGFWLSSEYWPPISCKISVHKQEGSIVNASVIRPELQEVTTQYPASISLSSWSCSQAEYPT